VAPLRFGDFSDTLDRYVEELHALADGMRKDTDQQHKLLDSHAFALVSDPTRPLAPPERESDVPAIDFAPLDQAAKQLKQSVQAWQADYDAQAATGFHMPQAQRQRMNALMGQMEQALSDPAGLPERPWFKHMIYAPGMLTGYGVKTVPGVREAIEGRRWDETSRYIAATAKTLDRYRAQIERLTALLK
jgi:N-acetylated-alpha-linked acidic dipeptidase